VSGSTCIFCFKTYRKSLYDNGYEALFFIFYFEICIKKQNNANNANPARFQESTVGKKRKIKKIKKIKNIFQSRILCKDGQDLPYLPSLYRF
jgi:hypothetical protein